MKGFSKETYLAELLKDPSIVIPFIVSDIRARLSHIAANADFIKDELDDWEKDEIREMAAQIRSNANSISNILEAVLEFDSIQRKKCE